MSDEWDVFGSDDEESIEGENALQTSDQQGHLKLIEKLADSIVASSTQQFLKGNRKISFSHRFFGVVDAHGDGFDCDVEALDSSVKSKMEQRGVKVLSFANEENMIDGAMMTRKMKIVNEEYILDGNVNYSAESKMRKLLVGGGFLFLSLMIEDGNDAELTAAQCIEMWTANSSTNSSVFDEAVWNLKEASMIAVETLSSTVTTYIVLLSKFSCCINSLSCRWKPNNKKVPSSFSLLGGEKNETWLDYERRTLESATISQSVDEKIGGYLSEENVENAVKALQHHGFVVIPGLFRHSSEQVESIKRYSKAILDDFNTATQILKEKCSVDVFNPGDGNDPVSYREMAMREDFRVDLRDGPLMKEVRKSMEDTDENTLKAIGFKVIDGGEGTMPTIIDDAKTESEGNQRVRDGHCCSLRYNPFVLDIIRKLQNPQVENHVQEGKQPMYKGNFGRWNFSGNGPNGRPMPVRVGQVGSVISIPSCSDQAIHADTPHIFEMHDCLPCHYANLFIFGEDQDETKEKSASDNTDLDGNFNGQNLIGGTAFVNASHKLSVTAALTADEGISAAGDIENTQNEMHMRIIRPSLQLGDAVIFDTRTLHFGLANKNRLENRGEGKRRPLLYINLTHSWFFDPKNWNNRQSIFEDIGGSSF
ncbi:hypothetical protein CTEN210_05359 [Chaetoceros tenuissimus]|uniref:Phytanoyl-CoA dioxygenase n=1 Tax=Chaetoceros tenuissimus TaxID=426638 RepID=A0AAD3CND7_9STRA|nr:hypothetical protein CTEN210_05359 [Chaetoceros tenuissimus]